MKNKIIAGLSAVVCAALALTGCSSSDARALKSTKEELKTVAVVGGHDVPMEIYRYVALNYRADYENGDPTVWEEDDGNELLEQLNSSVDDTIISLYTTMAMCDDYGISADDEYFSDTVDIRMDRIYESYGYDYAAYLADLGEYNMNDSVYRFIIRNDLLAEELVNEMTKSGDITPQNDDFAELAHGDDFFRVKQILISSEYERSEEECLERIERIKKRLDAGADFDNLLGEEGEDVFLFSNNDGYYICRGSFYTEFEDAAFSLDIGEISDIVKTPAGYSIIKRYEKNDEYIDAHLDILYETYRNGAYNTALEAKKATLSIEWNEGGEKYTIFNLK